jgi:hypothetical protein
MRHHTVYEGEGVRMILGLELIREKGHSNGTIPMGVDNTSAITATHSIKPGPGHYLWDLLHRRLKMVSDRHQDVDLLIRWIPGHIDIEGNEEADKEAKTAAKHGSSPNQKLPSQLRKTLSRSKSAVRQAYHAKLKHAATKEWQKSPRHERMKRIDPAPPSDKFSKQTSEMLRKHASLLFQLRSGHIPLNKHLHRIQKADSPTCPCCHQHNETVMHCPAHKNARNEMIRAGGRGARNLSKLLTEPKLFPHLLRFIGHSGRMRTVFGEIPDQPNQ